MPHPLSQLQYNWPKIRMWMASGLQWWWAELSWLLAPLTRRFGNRFERLFLVARETGELTFPDEDEPAPSGSKEGDRISAPGWQSRCAGRQTIVSVDPAMVMRLPISLPRAALIDIRAATKYRLITDSPIPVDQLCFDVRVVQPVPSGTKPGDVILDVALCRRAAVEALSATLETAGVSASVIGFSPTAQPPLAFVFHTSRGARDARAAARTNRLLTLSALLLGLGAFPATYLGAHWRTMQTLDEIQAAREHQDGRMALYQQQALTRAAQRDLGSHAGNVRLSNVLNDLALHLPHTAWLSQVRYESGTLKVQGYAPDPTAAARSLEGAHLLSRVKLDTVTGGGEVTGNVPVQFELSVAVQHRRGQ